ncbi:MAG: uncharacterized protein PWP25_526 [Sphaerochaeta sp.]|jgi:predicted oxidoreductase (fatty acid repression mutant protein)|uniref:Nitroreductase n=2 Tax=Sphaerochaeta halotolerans TaxID=2293840 RepID=A0A372MGN7_9SPIR|nr:nitroreductase family protein [Spirochaetaceae bacterium]MDK2859340.1 uncharacterized protein [Sphaerochaeta sp.]MDN5333641.1 uncharacterized protein [Sphaerochaeta sp.]MXI85803.1 nitroreductase [Sphaerochaeta halotolerans]RFU94558.1 nitroreductase [Sphaerochaeta halotolerans]
MESTIINSMKKRRTIYNLGKELPVMKSTVEDAVREVITYAPSAFNSQTSRAVILYGKEHDWLWDLILSKLLAMVPDPEQKKQTEDKIAAFKAASGTILFFEEMATILQLQEQMPLYSENFTLWSHHGTGIAQFSVWTVLAELKVGASLQHYGNLIEKEVLAHFSLPASWSLTAQMPFGSIMQEPGDKDFLPSEERVRVIS